MRVDWIKIILMAVFYGLLETYSQFRRVKRSGQLGDSEYIRKALFDTGKKVLVFTSLFIGLTIIFG